MWSGTFDFSLIKYNSDKIVSFPSESFRSFNRISALISAQLSMAYKLILIDINKNINSFFILI